MTAAYGCPVEGCTASAGKGMLMCRDDWYRVPQDLRRAVGRAWRSFRESMPNSRGRFECTEAYVKARGLAIEAASKKRIQESPLCD
jgi:hypothetical protein